MGIFSSIIFTPWLKAISVPINRSYWVEIKNQNHSSNLVVFTKPFQKVPVLSFLKRKWCAEQRRQFKVSYCKLVFIRFVVCLDIDTVFDQCRWFSPVMQVLCKYCFLVRLPSMNKFLSLNGKFNFVSLYFRFLSFHKCT